MKYKCDVNGCDFECEFKSELIKHFETKHKDELTNYCINWMKSKGLTPIETCRVCKNKIKVKTLELHDGHRVYNGLVPLFTGICCSSCQEKLLTDYMWKYEPWQGTHLQCLYERRNTWIKRTNPEGRSLSEEHRNKISKSIKKAIDEGRLNPKENKENTIKLVSHRPFGIKTSWLKYCKEDLRNGSSYDEKAFSDKLKLLKLNFGTQIYFDLGSKYRFLDYFIFYKFHKIDIEIDGDYYHNLDKDLEKDKLLYEKHNVLTLRINSRASRMLTCSQIINSIESLINNGPYWNIYKSKDEIYDWKWLVHYGYYKSCKTVHNSGYGL